MALLCLAIMLGFGGACGIIGWCLGHESGMRKARGLVSDRANLIAAMADAGWRGDEAHGDTPTLPPLRDRRFSATDYRSRLS